MKNVLMIALSNNTLVNTIVIKEQYFKKEKVDLVILVQANYAGFDKKMYEIVMQKNIFSNVYLLESNEINYILKYLCNTKLKKLFYFRVLKKYMEKKLYGILSDDYTEIICPMFTQYIPNIIDIFEKRNFKINFYEEGTSTYDCNLEELIKFDYLKVKLSSQKIGIKWYLKYYCNNFIFIYKMRKYVEKKMYVFWPEHLKDGPKDNFYKLDSVILTDESKNFLRNYYMQIDYVKRYVYEKAKVVFLSTYITDTLEMQDKLIHDILEIIPNRDVILKMHPSSTPVRTKFAADEEDKCYIDRDLFYFESLNVNGGFSNKILISVNTSAVMNAKTMFQEEPYMIFLYKMTSYYYTSERFRTVVDKYTNDLMALYSDKSKIAVPNSTLEFKYILKKFYKQVTRKDIDI